MALSNKTGIIKIFDGGTGASIIKGWADISEQYFQTVPVSTLDIIIGSRFHNRNCFVLVDIEGAEKFMLEGASSFLSAKPRPIWMVEIAITEHQPAGVAINPHLLPTFQLFWENGYEAWTADKSLRIVQPAEVENIVKNGKNTLLTHNFIFIEKDGKKAILET